MQGGVHILSFFIKSAIHWRLLWNSRMQWVEQLRTIDPTKICRRSLELLVWSIRNMLPILNIRAVLGVSVGLWSLNGRVLVQLSRAYGVSGDHYSWSLQISKFLLQFGNLFSLHLCYMITCLSLHKLRLKKVYHPLCLDDSLLAR